MAGESWFPCSMGAWPHVVERLEGTAWPVELMVMDYRFLQHQVRTGARRKIPGRPALRKRWGTTG